MKTFLIHKNVIVICGTMLITFATSAIAQIVPGFEVYLCDARPGKGTLFELIEWPPSHPAAFPKPVFTSKVMGIGSIAISPDGWVYFVDKNHTDIYKTNGSTESVVFRHNTYIRDLAFNSQGTLFFSEATGAGNNGTIYQFDRASRQAKVFHQVPLSELDGYWAGDFAFDPSDQLFVSSGNHKPASIYQYAGEHFTRKYQSPESITGFSFVSTNTLLFTNHANSLYKLDNFSGLSVLLKNNSFTMISDVVITALPAGSCSISGRLTGGQKYWNLTFVGARGPNFMWRETVKEIKVNSDGSYSLNPIPPGRYMVYTDMHADAGMGFKPAQRSVSCTGTVGGIDFQWPSGK